jgi:hypothetical protein
VFGELWRVQSSGAEFIVLRRILSQHPASQEIEGITENRPVFVLALPDRLTSVLLNSTSGKVDRPSKRDCTSPARFNFSGLIAIQSNSIDFNQDCRHFKETRLDLSRNECSWSKSHRA